MKKTEPDKESKVWQYVLVLAASFLICTGAGYFYFKDKFAFESSFISDIESNIYHDSTEGDGDRGVRLYTSRESDVPVQRGTVLRKDALLVAVEDFIRKSVEAYKVRLLDLYLDREGVIYIDFGSEIKKNFKGDAHEELTILAGLYTGIKATVPGLTALKILIEGKEAESLGGHIDISKPIGEEVTYNVQ